MSIIPQKCVNCIHHKKSDRGTDYCDYTEYLDNIGCPVPYPYFFKQEYPCKGHEEKTVDDRARYIEREKFLKKCAEAWGYAGVTIKAIEQIADDCTTADVVPKSEYDAVVSAVDNSTKEFLKLHDAYQNQKAEIERLEKGELREAMTFNSTTIKRCVASAIKEFAKFFIDNSTDGLIDISDLPDLVKEMTEEHTHEMQSTDQP